MVLAGASSTRPLLIGLVFGACLLMPLQPAQAGGFEIPDHGARSVGRGGAYAVGAADLSALHYNPGALAKLRGTRLFYSHNLTFHEATFQRATLSDAWGADAGTTFDPVTNRERLFPLGLFGVVSSDFGLENWTFALGAYGPSAVGSKSYPTYGPQAFMLTDMNVLMAYYSAAVAWKWRDVFGIGVTLQYVDLFKMDYGLVVDSRTTADLDPVPDPVSTQMITKLRLKDRTGFTALLGLWYRPHRRVELGVGGRVIPVFLRPEGGVATDKETLVTDALHVEMPLVLPVQLRTGVRYIHPWRDTDLFDVELDFVWENWSTIDAYDLSFDGRINGQEVENLRIGKDWRDTFSLRLGGDVQAIARHLWLRTGGFWESGAAPKGQSHLDFPSFMRGGIGLGATGGGRGVYLTVGYMHIFQERREISELNAKVFQQRPLTPCPEECNGLSGVPANAGAFETSFDQLSIALDVRFDELFAGVGKKRRKSTDGSDPAVPTPAS